MSGAKALSAIVYRLSHLTADKVLMHGYTVSVEMDVPIARSQQPVASSDLAPDVHSSASALGSKLSSPGTEILYGIM